LLQLAKLVVVAGKIQTKKRSRALRVTFQRVVLVAEGGVEDTGKGNERTGGGMLDVE